MCLYLDDSGTRHPDRTGTLPAHGHDWFGIGGVMMREADEDAVRARHACFCQKWNITTPLHSAEIRARSKNFKWIGSLPDEKQKEFMGDLGALATSLELTAIACVVDRPGYNHRYVAKYGRERWSLCRTAFMIVVERAAKFSRERGAPLRVYVERADKETDKRLKGYYDEMRSSGHPFNPGTSSKYAPLTPDEFKATLYDFKTKDKTSPPMQLADLCLWPVCIGGYDPTNIPYVAMKSAGMLIDSKMPPDSIPFRGIKYSCWDLEEAR